MMKNKSKKNEDKQKRLAKALRENLMRRKQKTTDLSKDSAKKHQDEKPDLV